MGSVIGQKIDYLTIIPQARMGCESIAHEAEGGYSGLRNNNCFSKIQLVGKKLRE